MQRILFWLGLILLINWWWRRQSRAAVSRRAQRTQSGPAGAAESSGARAGGSATPRQLAEPMARCDTCGVHIPLSEALRIGDGHFCSAEHARESAKHMS